MVQENIIGVIGGMGPYAGLDLVRKILDETEARKDQDHLPVALLSYPGMIRDRSEYLFENAGENPGEAIAKIALRLDGIGATVAGIPCNTAHAQPIFDLVETRLRQAGARLRLLHMIRETALFLRCEAASVERIGLLSTLAVYRLRVQETMFAEEGFEPILPDEHFQENVVNRTIFDPTFGIKAQANPVTPVARQNLLDAIEHLRERGAQAIILGCTELPLAIPENVIDSMPVIDPTRVLARSLIRESYPNRLKPGASTRH